MSNLTSIEIPNSVTSIGGSVFADCSGLTSIVWNPINYSNFKYDTSSPFYKIRTQITSFEFGDSIEHIPSHICYGMSNLTSITIPDSVTSIGEKAFSGCSGFTSITVDGNNTVYDSRDNCNAIIETSSNKLIAGCKTTIIPDSVTSIDNYAFYDCMGLTSITIPNSVTSIGNSVFERCSELTSIIVNENNTVYDSRNNCNAIIKTAINTLMYGCKTTIIPDSITSIGNRAFYQCSGLTSITIPNSVTSIGENAFYDCDGLTSIEIPNSVISIGYRAFYGCDGLTSIIIPDSVISINTSAFSSCVGLTSVVIGNSVNTIG